MQDELTMAVQSLIEHYLNYSEATLASQITSLAIQLSETKEKHDVLTKIDLAAELLLSAKKKITREMIQG